MTVHGYRPRPRRRMGSELLPLAAAAAIQFAVVLAVNPFLHGTAAAAGRHEVRPRAACALVELSEEEEAKAVAASRSAWHVDSDGVKRLRIEMFEALPEAHYGPVSDAVVSPSAARGRRGGYDAMAIPTDLRSPPPAALPAETDAPRPAFSRDSMLSIDGKFGV